MAHFLLVIIFIVFRSHLCTAHDTLLLGQSLSWNQTLVSKNGLYEFGIYSRYYWNDESSNRYAEYDERYYLGIWFAKTPYNVLWVANKDNPLICYNGKEFLSLVISSTGNLVLTELQSLIWSSNFTRGEPVPISIVLVLYDSGNLVLQDSKNSSRIIWQSFEHPTDTWFPGAPLGFDKVTGENISLTSSEYWSSETFCLEIDPSKPYGFIIKQVLGRGYFSGTFPNWMDMQKINGTHLVTFDDTKQPIFFLQLSSWQIYILHWVRNPNYLPALWSAPESFCDMSLICGPNSLCSNQEGCSCPSGFQSAGPNYWKGCSRVVPLNCQITSNSSFYLSTVVDKCPDDPQSLFSKSEIECATTCSSNCSCSAYSYSEKCNLWFGDLTNIIIRDDGHKGYKIKLRVAAPILEHKKGPISKHRIKYHWIVTVLVIGAVTLLGFVFMLCWKHMSSFIVGQSNEDNFLKMYSYAKLKTITNNFSDKVGEGGFGCVFKGSLPNSAIVAVKRMKISFCEEKQFRTEVQTIGIIQHTNLVRLLGLCSERTKRLLVYEYMPNGSLDSHLFSDNKDGLDWDARYRIMLGIARGLAYLHQECIDCIIHCDIKPENVLLDAHFCPKIADFGMAKLLGRDFSRVLTTIRGTIGYLAPEWISGQPITQKTDVYSFGMVLFEIISGRRNIDKIKNRECTYFPLYAAIKINQGDILCLLDNKLQGNANMEELSVACKVACWCIQESETDRPSMPQVVQMLEGTFEVSMPQVPSFLQRIVDIENDSMYSVQD